MKRAAASPRRRTSARSRSRLRASAPGEPRQVARRRDGTGTAAARRATHAALAHDSAERHVRGQALYVDDLPEPAGLLHAALRLSDRAHARILSVDPAPALARPGVAAVLTARDLAHCNDVGPVVPGDPVLAGGEVSYDGQALAAVAAETLDQARSAAAAVAVALDDLPTVLTAEAALERGEFVLPTMVLRRGDAAREIGKAPHRLEGRVAIGGQDHFYLEGQIAMAVPREGGAMLVQCSTQNPSEVQHFVARVLGLPAASVAVEVRRMGGAFGGKETQATQIACLAAALAVRTGRPVKLRIERDDDMRLTGKRHDFLARYQVGFDARGRIRGLEMVLASRCGHSVDLSGAINDRAMLHADNAYFLPAATVTSHRCRTHTVSNTAFRGFGGPQGMMAIEQAVDDVARHLGLDPLEVRLANLYGGKGRDRTHYGQPVESEVIRGLVRGVERSAAYWKRRGQVARFNAGSPWLKRGLALTPVKFGISFTALQMNQAGALVHVYGDGSVHLNHGGTEMGQGLFVKVAQVVADELGVGIESVQITATTTEKVPNTSPTAASAGADMNGKAAQAAARRIRGRMAAVAARALGGRAGDAVFAGDRVRIGRRSMRFSELAHLTHQSRVSLSSTGFYRTPKIHWDKARLRGRPFYYFACGAAVAEVEVDVLTGEYRLLRADLLHDVGDSLNPAVDLGQVEGGFVQGMGWLTGEELWWDGAGRLRTHAPSTYKIPTCGDVPADLRVTLRRRPGREDTIHRSKAVGEPPLMLAISVFQALKDAVAAAVPEAREAGGARAVPRLDAPATPERVLLAIEELRARAAATAEGPTAGASAGDRAGGLP